MTHGVSMAHARRLARSAGGSRVGTAKVSEGGTLHAELTVNAREAGLRPDRGQDVRLVLYEAGSAGGPSPTPIPTQDGRHAIAIPLSVRTRRGEETVSVRADVRLASHAGERVDVILEPVRRSRAIPIAITAMLACCAVAAWLLGAWGDPSARKGHYEGKPTEEIQADLDREVAWYAMDISVASRITAPEGETRIEARIENVEANHCDQKVRIWEAGREDDVLYESGAIAPGEYLQYVELAHPLPAGTHTLTVEFQGYEQAPTLISDEGAFLGHDTFGASCAAEVTLDVLPANQP